MVQPWWVAQPPTTTTNLVVVIFRREISYSKSPNEQAIMQA